jgi:hypothetical protein
LRRIGGRVHIERRAWQLDADDSPCRVAQQVPRALVATQAAQFAEKPPREYRGRAEDTVGETRDDGPWPRPPGSGHQCEVARAE